MKASSSIKKTSDDHRTQRKRRSSSSGSGPVNEVPDIVLRLSEACSKHKKTHEASHSTTTETQQDSKETKSALPSQCSQDLNNLRSILHQVDQYYNHARSSEPVEGSTSFKQKKITASDVSNLCVFYGAVLSGSFCPHSLSLLDYGNDVEQIIDRVYNLIQFFASDCIIHDTLSHLKRIYGRGSNANNARSSSSTCVSDQIAFTAAAFLNTIHPQHLIDVILTDMVTALYDLSVVGSISGILPNARDKNADIQSSRNQSNDASPKTHLDTNMNSTTIEIEVFSETHRWLHPDSTTSPHFIQVPTHEVIYSLQCGITRIMFILLVLRHAKSALGPSLEDTDQFSVVCVAGEERFTSYNSSWLFDLLQTDGDLRATLLTVLKQIIAHQSPSSHSLLISDISRDLLLLNTKLTASNLLTLLLPDFSKAAEECKYSLSLWSDLSELITSSIHAHLVRVQLSRDESTQEKILNTVESMNYQLSVQLSNLLRDTMIVPLFPYQPEPIDMLKIRNRAVRHLWNSLNALTVVRMRPSQISLCTMILRTIHCSLHVTDSRSDCTNESDLFLYLATVRNQARAYFISRGLLSCLLSLIKSEIGHIAVQILIELTSDLSTDEPIARNKVSDYSEGSCKEDIHQRKRPRRSVVGDEISLDSKRCDLGLEAILPLPCLQNFWRTTLAHGEMLAKSVQTADTPSEMDASKALDMIAVLEITESLLATSGAESNLSGSLKILYKALHHVITMIISQDASEKSLFAKSDHAMIIQRLLSYALRSVIGGFLGQLDDDRKDSKASLLQSLSALLIKHLKDGNKVDEYTEGYQGERLERDFEPFDAAVISMLSQRHKELIGGYISNRGQSCQSYCSQLHSKLALSGALQGQYCVKNNCLCALYFPFENRISRSHNRMSGESTRFYHSLFMLLVGDIIPFHHRCVITILELRRILWTAHVDQLPDHFSLHKWLCSKSNLASVYLAVLPLQLLHSSLNQRNIFLSSMESESGDNYCQMILLGFNRYVETIESMDFLQLFRDLFLEGNTLVCTQTLHSISSIVQWYSLFLSCSSHDDEWTLKISSNPVLLHILRSSVSLLMTSDVSSDELFMELRRRRSKRIKCVGRGQSVPNSVLVLIASLSDLSQYFQCPKVRQALWRCLWSVSLLLDTEALKTLVAIKLYSSTKDPMSSLEWLLWTSLHDESTSIRNYGSCRVGHLLMSENFDLLRLLTSESSSLESSIDGDRLGMHFITKCDALIERHGPIDIDPISPAFISYIPFHKINTSSSPFSTQMASVLLFSSICQFTQPDSELGVVLLTEAVRRIIRFYLLSHKSKEHRVISHSQSLDMHKISWSDIISSYAFEQLHLLGETHHLWTKLMERCEEVFTPILFYEILSLKGDKGKGSYEYTHKILYNFIQTFLLKSSMKSGTFGHLDELFERYDGTLFFTDEALPAVISDAVSKRRYDFLLACAGFRSSLARCVTAAGKSRGRHFTSEYIIGMVFRQQSCKEWLMHSLSTKELMRQTAILCVTDREGLRILGRLLPSLLLESSLQPLRFFLHTVLQSEVSLRDLLIKNEIKMIIGIIWEMGCLEKEFEPDGTVSGTDVQSSWMDDKFDNRALRALKRGALILRKKDGNLEQCLESLALMENSNECFTLEALETTESWVRSHFMMLLVNVDNTKWKGGRVATKIQALKCLKVLLRFLLPDDASRYMTQVLTMIDAAMHMTCSKYERYDIPYKQSLEVVNKESEKLETMKYCVSDPPSETSRLRLLGVSSLSHFLHLALTHQVKIVGDALCKIVVILFPLLSNTEDEDETKSCTQVDPYQRRATLEAVAMIESFLTGDKGPKLAPYFQYVPFLPAHPLLRGFRSSLKIHGVDLDSLIPDLKHDEYMPSIKTSLNFDELDCSSTSTTDGSNFTFHSGKCTALRSLLRVSEYLVKHENENVRYAALSHLNSVLKRNRGLFHYLVESNDFQSRSLTIVREEDCTDALNIQDIDTYSHLNIPEGGIIGALTRSLLQRCTEEVNERNRLALASCLGEVGAIDPSFLGQQFSSTTMVNDKGPSSTIQDLMPWKSKSIIVDFELNLVTKYFVAALRSSPTPKDQHKIAFAIQEVLKLLDNADKDEQESEMKDSQENEKGNQSRLMSPWLLGQLTKADVIDVIKPFWSSLYKQQEPSKGRDPPFYNALDTFFLWVSSWSRYMIEKSHGNGLSPYRKVFFACRSAIRSHAGIGVIEYILPMLVLDAIVFGDSSYKSVIIDEIIGVLRIHERTGKSKMNDIELLKSLGCIFNLLDTLQSWANTWVEFQHEQRRQSSFVSDASDDVILSDSPWPVEKCIDSIINLLEDIPLNLRAKAAASVGMHARSLLLLEMEGRRQSSSEFCGEKANSESHQYCSRETMDIKMQKVVQTHISNIDLSLMQYVLGELNDLDAMSALARYRDRNGLARTYSDKVHEREYNGDFDGVIHVYEQATQIGLNLNESTEARLKSMKDSLNASYVRALLKMGRLESAHLHVQGILASDSGSDTGHLIPSAVEASWRLCSWELLDQLLQSTTHNPSAAELRTAAFDNNISRYQMFCGKALLGICKSEKETVHHALEDGRKAVMSALAIASRENYSRAYPYLITLHSMTEIEEVAELLAGENDLSVSSKFAHCAESDSFPGWNWKARLKLTGNDAEAALPLLNVRISLSRLAEAKDVEAKLWLDVGRMARKSGLVSIAVDALAHAEALHKYLIENHRTDEGALGSHRLNVSANECRLQLAKIMYVSGKSSVALQMLEDETFQRLQLLNQVDLYKEIRTVPLKDEIEGMARRAIQVTEWMIDGGFKNASEVIARYRFLQTLVPTWEKAHFSFAKYLDSVLYHRAQSQSKVDDLKLDEDLLRMESLKVDDGSQRLLLEAVKEYAESLRLNQKHVFLCLPRLLTLWFDFTALVGSSTLRSNQDRANDLLKDCIKTIPAISYYTVLPQLVSRLNHSDEVTSAIVSAILRRVLTKFPKQAMWGLAWLRNSVHPERQVKGEEIFKGAQKNMQRCENDKTHDLLAASKGLFVFLIQLAKYQPKKQDSRYINVRSWKGEVSLEEFLPPVQAALTITRNAIGGSSEKEVESFPPFVPRMRSFSTQVQVMSSKAKPKKLTAFAVPRGRPPPENTLIGGGNTCTKTQPGDIGEMHFLVKQEAKGDLRKDARVQDFNNVVNRLLATSSIRNSSNRRKRRLGDLRLKTFSVVCLSEDCGIIEWVPNTDSLRNIVSEAYNPQAPAESIKRRGKRIANFGDPNLRDSFQKCQDLYIKNGDLSGAVKLFDELCIKEYPPLLYWWFVHKFEDPHKWFEARSLFTLSSAVWSAVGHVIGLGDRHSENLLIDVSSGECVHVDFDCIFDKGLHLPRPEVVPFRLTPNILDAFGPCGADGTFTGSLSSVMSTLRENRDLLLSVLEPFLKDPIIDWKRHRGQQTAGETVNKESSDGSIEAKRSIKVIEGRLKGMYNLRNPNYKKIKRTDGQAPLADDDDMANIIPLSVEGQVHKMINEACSHENLVQLYVGWMSWL